MKFSIKKALLAFFVMVCELSQSQTTYECVRWTWIGDVYDRKVVCLEWRKKEK